jgi:DNA-binding MarR family transcriptional regulator
MRSGKGVAIQDFKNLTSDILKNVRNEKKSPRQLERHFKGVANHRRIQALMLISRRQGITLDEISAALDCNFKTIAEHVRRLHQAGLINKAYVGRNVGHALSPYGKKFITFIRTF